MSCAYTSTPQNALSALLLNSNKNKSRDRYADVVSAHSAPSAASSAHPLRQCGPPERLLPSASVASPSTRMMNLSGQLQAQVECRRRTQNAFHLPMTWNTKVCPLLLLSALCACSGERSSTPSAKVGNTAVASQPPAGAPGASAAGCDASLWNHVYNPTRLQQLAPCLSVTGVIDESDADPDGDQHFLLKLDSGQDSLVNKRNAKKKGGDIVLEIVCANPTKMKKVKSACTGYTNPIAIPRVGTHITATGTYVLDTHNGWVEIHPVSRLEVR